MAFDDDNEHKFIPIEQIKGKKTYTSGSNTISYS